MGKRRQSEICEINMTPMIDVVFQLIIFFIVTMTMKQTYNESIELEQARHGPAIKDSNSTTLVVEVDRRGWISISNAQLSKAKLKDIIQARFNRYGEFPVLIRGDKKTRHQDIRAVMDICTGVGLWRINFAAVKEKKAVTP